MTYNVSYVPTRAPRTPRNQYDHPTEALPADGRMERAPDIRAPEVVTDSVEDPGLRHSQEVEDPDAEQDLGPREVAECERKKAEGRDELREALGDGHLEVAGGPVHDRDHGHAGDEPRCDVPRHDEERHGETDPEQLVLQ